MSPWRKYFPKTTGSEGDPGCSLFSEADRLLLLMHVH